jgi:hypothetical protein
MLWTLGEKAWLGCSVEEEIDGLAMLRSIRGPNNETGRFTRDDLRETK